MIDDGELYTLEWRGRQTDPMTCADMREALESGQINSMYKINDRGRWRLLRDFLDEQAAQRAAPAASEPPPPYAAPPLPQPVYAEVREMHAPAEPMIAATAQAAGADKPSHSLPGAHNWLMYGLIALGIILIPVCVIGGYYVLRPAAPAPGSKTAEETPKEEAAAKTDDEPKKTATGPLSIEELSDEKSSFVVRVSARWEQQDEVKKTWELGGSDGSGVHIYNKDGYAVFVTNLHVLLPPKGARKFSARLKFHDKDMACEVVRVARYGIDLAKIRVKYPEGKEGEVLEVMHIDKLKVGQGCVAIGNALGEGISVTSGIISRFDEDAECRYVRTSAPISHGNSGGALFRQKDGALIGITTLMMLGEDRSAQNVNLAIPVDYIFSELFWLPVPE